FAAVQAWSDADHRARTIAAVNVLNAAFMTGATIIVAALQKYGTTVPVLFVLIGLATLAVATAIWKTMPIAWFVVPVRAVSRTLSLSMKCGVGSPGLASLARDENAALLPAH